MKAVYTLTLFIIGIFLGYYTGYYGVILMLVLLLAGIVFEKSITSGIKGYNNLSYFVNIRISLIVLILGASVAVIDTGNIPVVNDLEEYEVTGVIREDRLLASGEMYTVKIHTINGRKCKGDVTLFTHPSVELSRNDIISFRSTLTKESVYPYSYPKFSAKGYERESRPHKLGVDNSVRAKFQILRDRTALLIDNSDLGRKSKSLLTALIVADRSSLSKEEISMFRDAGVIHILAVSGMHIGIINILLLIITRPMVLVSRRFRYAFVLFFIWAFVLLTGCNLSTIRAAIMLSLANFGLIIDRRRSAFDVTCLALLFILILSPDAMFDMGLQLSFASVASITLFADRLNPIDKIKSKRTYNIYSAILATLIATATTWIITGYYFGEVALRFLPANLLILPFLPVYMIFGLGYLLLQSFGLGSSIIVWALNKFPEIIYTVLDLIEPHSSAVNVSPIALICWLAAFPLFALAIPKRPSYEYNSDAPAILINRRWMTAAFLMLLLSLTAISLRI